MKHLRVANDIADRLCQEFTPQEQNEILRKVHALVQENRERELRKAEDGYLYIKESMKGLNP